MTSCHFQSITHPAARLMDAGSANRGRNTVPPKSGVRGKGKKMIDVYKVAGKARHMVCTVCSEVESSLEVETG